MYLSKETETKLFATYADRNMCIHACILIKDWLNVGTFVRGFNLSRIYALPEISKNFMYLSAAVVTSCLPSADIAREYMQPRKHNIMTTAINTEGS